MKAKETDICRDVHKGSMEFIDLGVVSKSSSTFYRRLGACLHR